MAKNRKSERTAVRFAPAVRTFLLCLIIGGVGLGYVGQKNRIKMLRERKNELRDRHDKLERQRQALLWKREILQSFAGLEAQVKRMNLDLSATSPDRVVRITVQPSYPVKKPGDQFDPRQLVEMTVSR